MRESIERAAERIAPYVQRTPCRASATLSREVGGEILLKLESLQTSGSFKIRGVFNTVLSLASGELSQPLVAASTGNHAAAFVHALEVFGLEGRLFLPETAAAVKVDALRASGVPIEQVGEDCVDAEVAAAEHAEARGLTFIHPYADERVIAGQGTVAVEVLEQVEDLDAVVVPVGGGGLIGGVAAYVKAVSPEIEVVGCQPTNSCVMYLSLQAGRIVDEPSLPTLSDATAGGILPGSPTFELCRRFVDDIVLLDEEEIAAALRLMVIGEGLRVEGGGVLPVAAVLKHQERFAGRRVALVLSGSRIDDAVLAGLAATEE